MAHQWAFGRRSDLLGGLLLHPCAPWAGAGVAFGRESPSRSGDEVFLKRVMLRRCGTGGNQRFGWRMVEVGG